jgi:acid stress-induced BolA-like protein IbaG/YrbA
MKHQTPESNNQFHFENLVKEIEQIHNHFQQQAVKAVNISLTLRNWLIGYYIVEFEQNGADRANYGGKLLKNLSEKINVNGLKETNLKLARQFYKSYPEMVELITTSFKNLLPTSIRQLVTDQFKIIDNESVKISQLVTDEFSDQNSIKKTQSYYSQLIEKISFTHFVELIKIEDKTKRSFYELLILKSTPSINQLKHQINSLA